MSGSGAPCAYDFLVPLSEREQKILEEIEKNLFREDAQFARSTKTSTGHGEPWRHVRLGGGAFLLGFATLFAFFITGSLLVGIAAFVAMVAGIVLAANGARSLLVSRGDRGTRSKSGVARVVEQWEQRLRELYKRS